MTRHPERHRARPSLMKVLRGTRGAIDLASIMVGVLVIAIIAGVISAAVFAVIPWSQNEAAKQAIDSVRTAEGVALVKDDGYFDSAGLATLNYLEESPQMKVAVGPDCWVAASQSDTGNVYYSTSRSPEISEIAGTVAWCTLPPEFGNGPVTPPDGSQVPVGTGQIFVNPSYATTADRYYTVNGWSTDATSARIGSWGPPAEGSAANGTGEWQPAVGANLNLDYWDPATGAFVPFYSAPSTEHYTRGAYVKQNPTYANQAYVEFWDDSEYVNANCEDEGICDTPEPEFTESQKADFVKLLNNGGRLSFVSTAGSSYAPVSVVFAPVPDDSRDGSQPSFDNPPLPTTGGGDGNGGGTPATLTYRDIDCGNKTYTVPADSFGWPERQMPGGYEAVNVYEMATDPRGMGQDLLDKTESFYEASWVQGQGYAVKADGGPARYWLYQGKPGEDDYCVAQWFDDVNTPREAARSGDLPSLIGHQAGRIYGMWTGYGGYLYRDPNLGAYLVAFDATTGAFVSASYSDYQLGGGDVLLQIECDAAGNATTLAWNPETYELSTKPVPVTCSDFNIADYPDIADLL